MDQSFVDVSHGLSELGSNGFATDAVHVSIAAVCWSFLFEPHACHSVVGIFLGRVTNMSVGSVFEVRKTDVVTNLLETIEH